MSFGAPYMLFALLAIPMLAGFAWWAFRRRSAAIRRIGEPALVALLSATAGGPMRRVRLALWSVGVVLLTVALARPQWGSDIEIVETRGLQIMVVLDVSRSMLAADIEPTRLDRAKLEVADLISRLDGDAVGIALFSGASFVQLPLTTDYATARAYLNNARPSAITRQGTVIGEAIETATIGFSDKRESQKVIVIMSDGEIHDEENAPDPVEAARQAAGDGTVIYTVGFGSPDGAPVPRHDEQGNLIGPHLDKQGNPVVSRLDESLLQQIAEAGGGLYYRAGEIGGVAAIADEIETFQDEIFRSEFSQRRVERFQLFLLLGALSLFLAEILTDRLYLSLRQGLRRASGRSPDA